jgi:RP/EB family microtubule-associated protein
LGSQLRDIEILVQQQVEVLEADGKDDFTLREIQKILYSTEVIPLLHLIFARNLTTLVNNQEGFEVPDQPAVDEEETF